MPRSDPVAGGASRRYGPEEVIDAMYRGLLDRPAEPQGVEFHGRLLAEGAALADVVHGIAHSREYFETWLRGGDLPELVTEVYAGRPGAPPEPPIYVAHIMKTGGTALVQGMTAIAAGRFCLTQIFLDHLVALPTLVLEHTSFLAGHLGTEALDYLAPGTITATVIREPLERVLSHYAHVLRDPALASETDGLSLEEFVHSPRWAPYVGNFQARNLVQRIGLLAVWRDRTPTQRLDGLDRAARPASPGLPVQALFEFSPLDMDEPQLRRQALARLTAIDHVGVTEALDGLFADLAGHWGVQQVPALSRANVAESRPLAEDVPLHLREEILQANSVDVLLYEEAKRRCPTPATGAGIRGAGTPLSAIAVASVRSERGAARTAMGAPPPSRDAPAHAETVRRVGALTTLAVTLTAIVAALDTMFVSGIALMSLLVLGPCIAALTGRWRRTAAVGALALALAVLLGAPDDVWGTPDYLTVLLTLLLVGVFVTAAASSIERPRPRLLAGLGRGGRW